MSLRGWSHGSPNKSKMATAAIFNLGKMSITPDWIKMSAQNFMARCIMARGVATGGISVYIPPKSVTVLFTCETLTRFEIAMTIKIVIKKVPRTNNALGEGKL